MIGGGQDEENVTGHRSIGLQLFFSDYELCIDYCVTLRTTSLQYENYNVSQNIPPEIFWHFFPNGWEFLVQILHAY